MDNFFTGREVVTKKGKKEINYNAELMEQLKKEVEDIKIIVDSVEKKEKVKPAKRKAGRPKQNKGEN